MMKTRIMALILLVVSALIGWFVMTSNAPDAKKPFRLGLDLSGGSHLIYRADISDVAPEEIKNSMESLRDVIERRVNLFGVSEPSVQTETTSLGGTKEYRLVVELPGVTDLEKAIAMIGQTPLLEFKTEREDTDMSSLGTLVSDFDSDPTLIDWNEYYVTTPLTGRFLERASVQFSSNSVAGGGVSGQPIVGLQFDRDGAKLFEDMTTAHVGETIAIFLDGQPLSMPIVQQVIVGGQAVITGTFTPDEARELVGRLNSGALPVPIELISTQTVGPTLGSDAVDAGIKAGIISLLIVMAIMILWYRLPGLIASVALMTYALIMLALFKLIPITLTAPGIAGFIVTLGIAVDANILIFERMKEELRAGKTLVEATHEGFKRAWFSIRDANVAGLISAVILFWFGTSLIKGFALTLGLGVIISMITAISMTRVFLYAIAGQSNSDTMRWLYSVGLTSGKKEAITD